MTQQYYGIILKLAKRRNLHDAHHEKGNGDCELGGSAIATIAIIVQTASAEVSTARTLHLKCSRCEMSKWTSTEKETMPHSFNLS